MKLTPDDILLMAHGAIDERIIDHLHSRIESLGKSGAIGEETTISDIIKCVLVSEADYLLYTEEFRNLMRF